MRTYRLYGIIFFLCIAICCQAQRHGNRPTGDETLIRAYISTGLTMSQIEGDMLKGYKKPGFSGGIGATAPLTANRRWQAALEMNYTQRGVRETSTDIKVQYRVRGLTLNYVDIPLTVHFTDPHGGLTVGGGLAYGVLLGQPHGIIQYSPTYVVPDTSDMRFLRPDLTAVGDIRFPVWRNHLWLNLRLQYSLIPVKREWLFTEYRTGEDAVVSRNNCYNNSISIRLLWIF